MDVHMTQIKTHKDWMLAFASMTRYLATVASFVTPAQAGVQFLFGDSVVGF